MSERIDSLDRAKFYGMIFVIVGHVLLISPFDINKFPDLCKILIIYAFHMKLFFIVAGFLLFLSVEKYRDKIGLFYKNQIYRVLYPIISSSIVYTLLLVIFLAVFGKTLWSSATDVWRPIPLQVIGGTWFLFALFIFNFWDFIKKQELKIIFHYICIIINNRVSFIIASPY